MTKKTKLLILAAVAVVVAAVVVALFLCRGGSAQAPEETPAYDRAHSPEYRRIMEFEKAEQKRTMGEIARARQNLAEARDAGLEPEVVKELEGAVASAENELELERERMRANLRRELWKEQHPEKVKVLDDFNATQRSLMAEIDAAQKRLSDAKAQGAADEAMAALKGEVEALVKKLADSQNAADQELRKLSNK